jgi:hypothetical protein
LNYVDSDTDEPIVEAVRQVLALHGADLIISTTRFVHAVSRDLNSWHIRRTS